MAPPPLAEKFYKTWRCQHSPESGFHSNTAAEPVHMWNYTPFPSWGPQIQEIPSLGTHTVTIKINLFEDHVLKGQARKLTLLQKGWECMRLLTRLWRANARKSQHSDQFFFKSSNIFIFANYLAHSFEQLVFNSLHPTFFFFFKAFYPWGGKMKTSKASTNCSFKEQKLRMRGLFFLKSSSFCRKKLNPVPILLGQWSNFGFCVS